MRNSKIKFEVDDKEIWPVQKVAELMEVSVEAIVSKSAKEPHFKYEGISFKRITPVLKKRGTRIVRDDGREWNTIKECGIAIGVDPNSLAIKIREKQQFEYEGHLYTAPDYKPIHHKCTTRSKKLKIEKVIEQPVLKYLSDEPTITKSVKQEISESSTADKCVNLLNELAIERIKEKAYDKVSKVIDALKLLKEV